MRTICGVLMEHVDGSLHRPRAILQPSAWLRRLFRSNCHEPQRFGRGRIGRQLRRLRHAGRQ